jgi:chorismate synthase
MAQIKFDYQLVQADLNKRKPGQSKITTERIEDNEFEILSGLFEGKTVCFKHRRNIYIDRSTS